MELQWLEQMISHEFELYSIGTGKISTPEETWFNSTAELESYAQPGFVRLDQQVKHTYNITFTDPCSTETLCSTPCSTKKENNTRAEEEA